MGVRSANLDGYARKASLEYINPPEDSESRSASLPVAIFNLVCTIVGGGVLSLPYAFAKAGVALGVISLLIVGVASGFSAYILISCARRSGGQTYEDVAEKAFGAPAKHLTSLCIALVTFLSSVGYIVLMGDLIPPIIAYAFNLDMTFQLRTIVVLCCLAVVYPLCCMNNLSALKYTCILSFSSVVVLAMCVGYRSVDRNNSEPGRLDSFKTWGSPTDLLAAIPIIAVAYLCHFNVLPMNCELAQPTRSRIKKVVNSTIIVCSILYLLIGLFGYFYALEQTAGNILNNFPTDDIVIVLGRLCLGMTVLLNFPLIIMPERLACRKIAALLSGRSEAPEQHEYEEIASMEHGEHDHEVEHGHSHSHGGSYHGHSHGDAEHAHASPARAGSSLFVRMVQTAILILLALFISVLIPGVQTVWSIMGSSVSMAIAYIMPALFYIRLRRHKRWNIRLAGAYVLLAFSGVLACVCTVLAIRDAVSPPAPLVVQPSVDN